MSVVFVIYGRWGFEERVGRSIISPDGLIAGFDSNPYWVYHWSQIILGVTGATLCLVGAWACFTARDRLAVIALLVGALLSFPVAGWTGLVALVIAAVLTAARYSPRNALE